MLEDYLDVDLLSKTIVFTDVLLFLDGVWSIGKKPLTGLGWLETTWHWMVMEFRSVYYDEIPK